MRSVFLVEDEVLIRMMTAQMVEELGHRVIAEAGYAKGRRLSISEAAGKDLSTLKIGGN